MADEKVTVTCGGCGKTQFIPAEKIPVEKTVCGKCKCGDVLKIKMPPATPPRPSKQTICPKCGYARTAQDDKNCPANECSKCSVLYHRVHEVQNRDVMKKEKEAKEQKLQEEQKAHRQHKREQYAERINAMPPDERIKTIRAWDIHDRSAYLKAEDTINILNNMNFSSARSIFSEATGII